jgi:tetratricopeptide (TPR) repeat protein
MGMIEAEKGNGEEAILYYQKALELMQPQCYPDYQVLSLAIFIEPLASLYFGSGELDKALQEYEKITKLTKDRFDYGDIYSKSFYMLGRIYEQKDWKGKAIENYEKFLALWKDADPVIPEVEEARRSLNALKTTD